MRTVGDLFETSERVDISYLAGLAFSDSGDEYLRIQKDQMFHGERSDGTPIFNVKTGSEYYSESYAKYKGKDSPIDLNDTGSFYNEMFTKQESEGLLVDSDDSKADKLKDTYAPFLLNDESKEEFIPVVHKNLIGLVEKQINDKAI